MEDIYESTITIDKKTGNDINLFLTQIGADPVTDTEFKFNNERWFIDFHPFDHSDDIIVEEKLSDKYDKFLLVKNSADKLKIIGWSDRKTLLFTPARDIYRIGKKHHIVMDVNVKSLTNFKIIKKDFELKTEFEINQQESENLGHSEMISSLLAGLHYFAKRADVYFKDINQKDEFVLGDLKGKIFVRDAFSDYDMLIPEDYYLSHPEIDIYILCKAKAGKYNYFGYTTKAVVDLTRVVQMTGNEDIDQPGSKSRRIFAEQYKSLTDFFTIYEKKNIIQEAIEQQKYVPLHMHSEYSIGDGFGKLSYITDQLKAKGFKGAALTDHGTLAGVWEFQKHCLAKDLKPIIGIEAYIKIKDKTDEIRYHATILVKNELGWKNLLKLQANAVRENFYYKPNILLDDLLLNHEGLIVTAGCASGIIPKSISKNENAMAITYMDKLKEVFKEDFYFEIMLHNIMDNQKIMKMLHNYAMAKSIKCIFTTDTHYCHKSDKKYHDAIKAVNDKKKYGEAGYGDDIFYLLQTKDINERIDNSDAIWMKSFINDFMQNTFEVFDKCNFLIQPVEELDTLPKFDVSEIQIDEIWVDAFLDYVKNYKGEDIKTKEERDIILSNTEKKFISLCYDGLIKLGKYATDKTYLERLNLELLRVIKKGYVNYFLIMWDISRFCNEKNIMRGPGRGSVGASLMALCLDITSVDPIKYNLLYDRFISVIRKDFVDIDEDFQDDRREEIFNYLKDKYNFNHYAKVSTYSKFHAKGILRDVARIFDIPIWEANKVSGMVLERSGGDARANFSLMDTFEEFAEAKAFQLKYPDACDVAVKLEGHIRHKGVHAAAIILTEKDNCEYAPICKIGDEICFEWEKQLCEDMHLIKYDILGLKTLSVIKDACESANIKLPTDFEDSKVYRNIFKDGNTDGVFQFSTTAMKKFSSGLNINEFKDLVAANALFRPSCLHSGQAQTFANRKVGIEPVTYFHSSLENLTKYTLGVLIYQEQIMRIMNEVGGLSWATSEMSRKVMTKSKGKDALNKIRQDFVNGAFKKHKMNKEESERLFDIISSFGSYGFNEAHSVEYSTISYYCAWLKTYYPKHFFKACLKFETEEKEIKNYVQNMKKINIIINNPEINRSDFSYSIVDDKIYAGLNSITGIGGKIAEKIIKNRPYENLADFKKRCKVSDKILKGLIVADAFREFKINKKSAYNKDKEELIDFTDIELSQLIYKYTTLTPDINIKESYDFGNYNFIDIDDLPNYEGGKQYFVRGIVTDVLNKDKLLRAEIAKHTHSFERHLIYLNLNDGTGNIACQINPETYERFSEVIGKIKKQPVIVLGKSSKDGKKIYADMIQIVGENKTNDIDNLFDKTKYVNGNNAFIVSSHPAVSKNGKSYYKLLLSNDVEGLCFRFKDKLFPGMLIEYNIRQEPFMDVKILES